MKKIIFYIIIAFLIFSGCAQIGTLTGGDKDTEAPVLVKSKPVEQELNFKGDKLIFKFDEFFGLNNLNSVFLSSPPLLEKPDFKIKRKNLVVDLKEKLKDSTTYNFWFADAIEDYHEKNPLKAFSFVFSTGDIIDTMEISGSLKDAYTMEPNPDMYVMLYREYNDSTPLNDVPYYITKSDTVGNFKIDYIKRGKYRIFALFDLDANLKFSLPNEKIAFLDTFIVPKVIKETKIDSFKTGYVIHVGSEKANGDTLKNDTVIKSEKYIYSPKNINLLTFVEDNSRQYVFNLERELKGKCKFEFNKVIDSVLIFPLNFNLNGNDYYKEKADSGKSIIYWLKQKEDFNKDTLKFAVSYFNKDSVESLFQETDTVNLLYDLKSDTLQYFVNFQEFKAEHDSFSNYTIETETPILKIDTSKIKLFEVLDTMVADTKKQELLKSIRPAPDKLIFSIKRPYLKIFYVEALNIDTLETWYEKKYSKKKTLLTYKITEKEAIQKDTINVVLHYDNDYFKGQTQNFSDTISLPLYKQGLVSVNRISADTIKFKFKKNISDETYVNINDFEGTNWYDVIKSESEIDFYLKINKKELIKKDTLILTIRTKDFDNTLGNKMFFEYSKSAIFKFDKQKINQAKRMDKSNLYFVFNKPLKSDITINSLSFTINNEWFSKEISKLKDTVKLSIIDKFVSNIDTLKLEIKYKAFNRFNELEDIKDTVSLIYKRMRRPGRRERQKSKAEDNIESKLEKVSIEIPVAYKLIHDSISERKMFIKYPWKSGNKYMLKMDSIAFTDLYENYSKEEKIEFEIRKSDFYGKLKLNISNINKISKADFFKINTNTKVDTVKKDNVEENIIDSISSLTPKDTINTDSIADSKLKEGQLIVYIYNEKKELIKTQYTKTNKTILLNKLAAGKYSVKLIYDKNNNAKWDTGRYLKNEQPERILFYPNDINISGGEESIINWDL